MNRKNFLGVLGTAALVMATGPLLDGGAHAQGKGDDAAGSVYTMTNDPGSNEIVIFDRDEKGALTRAGSAPTGGLGSGGAGIDPLASQGSLVLTDDKRWLLAVNAGSNELSVFRVKKDGLELVDIIPSGGDFPTSLAVFGDLIYVLNAHSPNFTGFALNHKGHLAPIAMSTRMLPGVVSAQIGFDPHGDVLVVTDRSAGNGSLLVYPVGENGKPAAVPIVTASNGAGPFAFVFTKPRTLLVAEVGSNAVSSYELRQDGSLEFDTSVPNGQAATCWIVDVKGRYVFTANPGTNSLSSFEAPKGENDLMLLAGVAENGATPLDLAVAENGRFLYALDAIPGAIDIFRVEHDGSLTDLGPLPAGLPMYAQGLAAR